MKSERLWSRPVFFSWFGSLALVRRRLKSFSRAGKYYEIFSLRRIEKRGLAPYRLGVMSYSSLGEHEQAALIRAKVARKSDAAFLDRFAGKIRHREKAAEINAAYRLFREAAILCPDPGGNLDG